ncbi:hypothetical protein AHAS_Ahas13G0170900 [Arachis hypogaea]
MPLSFLPFSEWPPGRVQREPLTSHRRGEEQKAQAPSTNQLLLQILQRLDRLDRQAKRMECHNKCRLTHLKELIIGNHPPEEDPETPDFTLPTSTESHDDPNCGDAVTNPPLLPTDGTEDSAKL